jgi:SOS-response transcriptional repressor LexA
MDTQEKRRAQLRRWIAVNGVPTKEKSYFSQLTSGTASFGERAARRLEVQYRMGTGYLDSDEPAKVSDADVPTKAVDQPNKPLKVGYINQTDAQRRKDTSVRETKKFDANVGSAPVEHRRVPVISYVQAGLMTEAVDPYALGQGFETIMTDVEVSESAFGLEIRGKSMEPDFLEGDRVIVDPRVAPLPGDFVVAKNGEEEATFKKYRPRGTNDRGQLVFELVPLNEDFPTLNSERDHMRVIATMVEHRRYRRR